MSHGKNFIKRFDLAIQSPISSFFRNSIKKGIKEPNQIIEQAIQRSEKPKFHGKYKILKDMISQYYQEVLAYIGYLQYIEQLPPEAKSVIQQQNRDEFFKERNMGKHKPTAKQLDYLQILGYRGSEPETMSEASLLIDKLR